MPGLPSFDISRTALLAMDCQAGLVHIYANPKEEFAARLGATARAARSAGMRVIHVQVGFRPGLPEVGERNRLFAALKSNPEHRKLFEGAAGAIHPALGPEPADTVVVKHRISAFSGTDLDMILRTNEIDTLVMFGIATSGVVLSTLLEAQDADYRVFVISDCCADRDAELHRALIELLFAKRAELLTAEEFAESLAPAKA